jgi:hypothetical protein
MMSVQGSITEYDITAAGINVMYAEGIMKKDMYDYLMSLPKEIRNIKAGYFIRDNKGIQEKKEEALNEYIYLFIKENNIDEDTIMEIASDAIWLFNAKRIQYTKFKNVEFRFDRCASILVSWNTYRFYYDSWGGDFFIRGYKEVTPFTFRMKELLAMIDQNIDQMSLYKFIHEFKMDVLAEKISFVDTNKTIQLIDWLIDQFIK